jgi:hypothetical protein
MQCETNSTLVEKFLATQAVTKCPPRKVPGAGDLVNWATKRRFGSARISKERKRIKNKRLIPRR